jgi:flagellar motility protein MotE (MotC chaperone)
MYESMKAKEAARIFDRLDLRILVEVATLMNPRRLSDILAQMTPQAAERLTVELATRSNNTPEKPPAVSDLPKIEGRPGG